MAKCVERVAHVELIASKYCEHAGLPPIVSVKPIQPSESQAKALADAFEVLPEKSSDLQVMLAYQILMIELHAQWEFAKKHGIKFELHSGMGQPYEDSAAMIADVRENGRVVVFTGGQPHPVLSHPYQETGWAGNFILRGVHDLFGHAAGGYNFGWADELKALWTHAQMFKTQLGVRAISTELGGQTQWFYWGPQNFDESGARKSVPIKDRAFATQKVALLPESLTDFSGVIATASAAVLGLAR